MRKIAILLLLGAVGIGVSIGIGVGADVGADGNGLLPLVPVRPPAKVWITAECPYQHLLRFEAVFPVCELESDYWDTLEVRAWGEEPLAGRWAEIHVLAEDGREWHWGPTLVGWNGQLYAAVPIYEAGLVPHAVTVEVQIDDWRWRSWVGPCASRELDWPPAEIDH